MRAPMTPAPGSDAAEPPRATSPAARRRSSNAFSSSSPSALAACRSRRSSARMGLLGLLLRQALPLHQLDAAVLLTTLRRVVCGRGLAAADAAPRGARSIDASPGDAV